MLTQKIKLLKTSSIVMSNNNHKILKIKNPKNKIRLNKYLAMCGISSRRTADKLIAEGKVSINGKITKELGVRIDAKTDEIRVSNNIVKIERKRYIKLYKPKLFLTTLSTKKRDKKNIKELIKGIKERVYPVGRLDYDAEGLLILTNDGELANRIIHPANRVSKVYIAQVKNHIRSWEEEELKKGKKLEEGFVLPDDVKIIDDFTVKITFHEGKKHLVKRYLKSFGHPVVSLKRIEIGGVSIEGLKPGRWRDLSPLELKTLREKCNFI